MARVPAPERTRNELKAMFAGKSAVDRSSLVRQAARLIVEEALEGEATEVLGSGYYEHGAKRRGDAFELREGEDLHEALASFEDFSEAYQASVARPDPLFRRRTA
ncbi:MAG TPA: hypothetical protein VEQ87_02605 [Burkholderiales bacterium]|nr:hypothetical protein [Burkholderiales bacterium]